MQEEGSDSSVDDSVPINQSLKLPRVIQPSPSGKSVGKDKNVIELDEGSFEGTSSDAEDNDNHGGEDGSDVPEPGSCGENDNDSDADDSAGDGSDGDGSGDGSPGANMEVQPEAEEDEEDNDVPDLIHHRRASMEDSLQLLISISWHQRQLFRSSPREWQWLSQAPLAGASTCRPLVTFPHTFKLTTQWWHLQI